MNTTPGARDLDSAELKRIVEAALAEDLGSHGDVTTDSVVPAARQTSGRIVARQDLILAGLPVAFEVFRAVDPSLECSAFASDGDALDSGTCVASVSGSTRSILRGERTALNFLTRMCGIATATRAAVREIADTRAAILDTRKTAPGLRQLDKYAVKAGGGTNHRMGLHDAVMIKDTHLDSGISIREAVAHALAGGHPAERITAEVRNVEQLEEAIAAGAGRALLDNMDLDGLRRAVVAARGRIVLEASGGLRPGALRAVAETGVDFLSLGWLTHSAAAADLAMEMETVT